MNNHPQRVHRNEPLLALIHLGVPAERITAMDDYYMLRSDPKDVMKTYRAFRRAAWAAGLIGWIENRRDCDDWAWWYRGYCIAQFSKLHKGPESMCVGWHFYTDAMLGNHVICYEVLTGNRVVWIEPQKHGGIRQMTLPEIQSTHRSIF